MFGGWTGRKNKRLYRGGEGSRSLRADFCRISTATPAPGLTGATISMPFF
jgi:hypothetical protein